MGIPLSNNHWPLSNNHRIDSTDPISSQPLAFMGCGAVGRCLGRKLHEAGWILETICCRTRSSADQACAFIGAGTPVGLDEQRPPISDTAAIILLGTPDREIARAETLIAENISPGSVILHLSGALPSSILRRSKERGAKTGSMHPLQSFADPEASLKILSGSVFACEGDEPAVEVAFQIAETVGGRPIHIETSSKETYHAAASAASNFMIAPLLLALDLMEAAGLEREIGMQALIPLISGTAKNIIQLGVPDALTGPIERNDQIVIEGHLKAIAQDAPHLRDTYIALAQMTVTAARRKGTLSEKAVKELLELLE
ncbi:MAG: DUF2520 domain-containing protein [Planctomycetes bacterium]|nr:DUF2520 domain-containing protein [Planctomycetota bacterium]